jgi:pimeloyl-ACP methyl ester carboxylesterase
MHSQSCNRFIEVDRRRLSAETKIGEFHVVHQPLHSRHVLGRYADWRYSNGAGQLLVIFHGSINSAAHWAPFVAALAPYLAVYAVDPRGRGESADRETYSFRSEVNDITAVMDEAGSDAVLIGHSFGALVALGVALERPLPALVLY